MTAGGSRPSDRMEAIAEALRAAIYDAEHGGTTIDDAVDISLALLHRGVDDRRAVRSLARGLFVAVRAALKVNDPAVRQAIINEAAARIEWELRMNSLERHRLGAEELWESFGIKSPPLFDPRAHCWSEVPGAWAEDVSIMLTQILDGFPTVRVRQIKEKGGLRVYYQAEPAHDAAIESIIGNCCRRLSAKALYPLMPRVGQALARVRAFDALLARQALPVAQPHEDGDAGDAGATATATISDPTVEPQRRK